MSSLTLSPRRWYDADMDEASFPSDEDDGQLTGSDARVLIVDDEPEILRAFARMLRSFDVECAEGGREGLEVLKRSDAFDVVVLDLMMPDVDGDQRVVIEKP